MAAWQGRLLPFEGFSSALLQYLALSEARERLVASLAGAYYESSMVLHTCALTRPSLLLIPPDTVRWASEVFSRNCEIPERATCDQTCLQFAALVTSRGKNGLHLWVTNRDPGMLRAATFN